VDAGALLTKRGVLLILRRKNCIELLSVEVLLKRFVPIAKTHRKLQS
jgi:hypothetical protein